MAQSRNINSSGLIRLIIFAILLAVCVSICVRYSIELSIFSSKIDLINPLEQANLKVPDSPDVEFLLRLTYYIFKGYGVIFLIIASLICSFIVFAVTLIIFLIFRFVGIRKDSYITETEYIITKRMFFVILLLSAAAPMFYQSLIAIIWGIILNAAWGFAALPYVITLENKYLAIQRAEEKAERERNEFFKQFSEL